MSHIRIIRDRVFVDSNGQFSRWEIDGKQFCVGVEVLDSIY